MLSFDLKKAKTLLKTVCYKSLIYCSLCVCVCVCVQGRPCVCVCVSEVEWRGLSFQCDSEEG